MMTRTVCGMVGGAPVWLYVCRDGADEIVVARHIARSRETAVLRLTPRYGAEGGVEGLVRVWLHGQALTPSWIPVPRAIETLQWAWQQCQRRN